MRLGFAVKVLGEGGIKECDARRWQSNPHLRCSLDNLRQVLEYCHRSGLNMYRMSSGLAPYLTHPDLPQFHHQLEEAADELAAIGELAKRYDIRLSLHPSQYIVLNSNDDSIADKSARELIAQGDTLDAMGLGSEAVVVTHVGGAYGDKAAGIERFARRFAELPERTQRRLVVENDDVTYSSSDALRVHDLCGARVIFDNLHYFCNNPEHLPLSEALARSLATWPDDQTPKIHYSSPRTEAIEVIRKAGKSGEKQTVQTAPELRLHSDYINPFEFMYLMEKAKGLRPFDVMIEAKSKDLATLKLKKDLARYGNAGS